MIEVDNRIHYIRSVFADSLNMFQDINDKHDYIQYELSSIKDNSDQVIIWDLTKNEAVENLD